MRSNDRSQPGLIAESRAKFTRVIPFLLSFGAGKVAVYCVPLVVAAMASPEIYGSVEVAYATTLLVATALISAPLHGLSHRFLIFSRTDIRDQAAALVLGANLFSLCALGIGLSAGLGAPILLILAVSGVTATQIVLSFLLRIKERPGILAWIDGLVLLLGMGIVGVAELTLGGATLRITIFGYVAVGLLAAALAAYVLIRDRMPRLWQRLRENLHLGATMAVYAMFGTWIAVSGRILVGLTSPHDLPAFGVAFRIAGLALGVQQLALTAFWNQIYTSRTRRADGLLARAIGATAVVVALIAIFGRQVIASVRFEALDGNATLLAQSLLPPVSLHVFFWSAQVLLQARINRLGAARAAIVPLALVSGAGLFCIIAAHLGGARTIAIVWLIACYSAAYFATTWITLARRGFPHVRSLQVAVSGGLVLALISLL
jgi:hypothetical protein